MTPEEVRVGEVLIGPSGATYEVVDVVDDKVHCKQLDYPTHFEAEAIKFDPSALTYFRKSNCADIDIWQ